MVHVFYQVAWMIQHVTIMQLQLRIMIRVYILILVLILMEHGLIKNAGGLGGTPTITAAGTNWELSLSTHDTTIDNADGTVTAIFIGGILTSDCYNGEVSVEATYEEDETTTYPISDITLSIVDASGVILSSTSSFTVGSLDRDVVQDLLLEQQLQDWAVILVQEKTDGTGTVVDNDLDDDGVCDDDEIVGCSDISACNYVANATDEGEDTYPNECGSCPDNTGSPIETLTCDYSAGLFTLTDWFRNSDYICRR